MTKKTTDNKGSLGTKALEMVMRDVLGGMEEFSIMKAYESTCSEFKVISIQPSTQVASNDLYYELDYLKYLAHELNVTVEDDNTLPQLYDQTGYCVDAEPEPRPLAEVIVLDEYLKRKNMK